MSKTPTRIPVAVVEPEYIDDSTGSPSPTLADKLAEMATQMPEHVWEQLPGEGTISFEDFCKYRDMSPSTRSIQAVADARGVNPSGLYQASMKWKWKSRAVAWDKHRDSQRLNVEVSEIVAMRRRHVRMALMMQTVGESWFIEKIEEFEQGIPVKMSAREAASMIEIGVKLEINSTDVEAAGDNDLTVLSSEELIQYTALRQKIAKGNNNDN